MDRLRRSAPLFDRLAGSVTADARHRHRRSRREPRRARRAHAQPVRVRADAARAADRRRDRAGPGRSRRRQGACRSTRPSATSICCRRCSTPSARRRDGSLPGASLLDTIAAGRGAGPAVVLRGDERRRDARLGAAARRARRAREVHRPADRGDVRPRGGPEGGEQRRPRAGRPRARAGRNAQAVQRGASRSAAAGDGRHDRAAALARLHRRRQRAPSARSTPTRTIRSGWWRSSRC